MCFPVPFKHDHFCSLSMSWVSREVTLSLCLRSCGCSKEIRVWVWEGLWEPKFASRLRFRFCLLASARVGVRRGRNPPRNLQISSIFKSVFATVSFLKETGRKKASVRRALHSGSRLPATRTPRHLNSLATTRSGLSAAAGWRCSSQRCRALGS